ncbi:MAG: tetratricopeptide repeat protein [Chloroflexi bacterium]|nr:tetratricopeptide repeat protein [Chloroflexota bacterium]
MASALRVREQTERTLLESVGEALHDKHMLLVLDNCEHLIEACAQLAQRLLTMALPLRILATSREALNVLGETTWLVPPLGVPSAEFPALSQPTQDSGRSTEHSEPVALFVARAQSVMPTFHLTAQTAGIIADICQALDGIPLAIELAAARVRTLSVADISARLDERFQLLRAGNRAALPRHQSLRAALDWSYDLLGDDERVLFRRFAVFRGSAALEAVQVVCTDEGSWLPDKSLAHPSEVLDLLAHLIDKSLLVVTAGERETRFSFLETVRQYAREQLRELDEEPRLARKHVQFFTAFAEEAAAQLNGAHQTAWLKRMRADEANLRAALDWCFAQQDTEFGLRLTLALNGYWRAHSAYREGVERLRQSLALPWDNTHLALRARTLGALQFMLGRMGDYAAARECGEACLRIERELGDPQRIASALCNLASVVGAQGHEASARALQAESLAMFRQIGDAHGQAMLCTNMGEWERLHGHHSSALAFYDEALALYRELGNRGGIALVLHNMAHSHLAQGDALRARQYFVESLMIYEEMNNPEGIAMCLAGFAAHAVAAEEPHRAARWFGASDAIYERISARMDLADRAVMDAYVEQVRAALGADAFERAWNDGRALSVAEAVQSVKG